MCSSDVSTIARLYQKNVPWLPVQKRSEFNSLPLTSLQDHKWPVGRLLEVSNKSPSSITNYKIRVTFTTLPYQRARTEPFWLRPLHFRMVWSHPAGRGQRTNKLIMSQRFACSWCCKASCFISSHLAYVPRKGLNFQGERVRLTTRRNSSTP